MTAATFLEPSVRFFLPAGTPPTLASERVLRVRGPVEYTGLFGPAFGAARRFGCAPLGAATAVDVFGSFSAAGSTRRSARSFFCAGARLTPASDRFLRVRTNGVGADFPRLTFGTARSFGWAALSTAAGTNVFASAGVEGVAGLSALPLFCLCTRFTPASERFFLIGAELAFAVPLREAFAGACSSVSAPPDLAAGLRLEPGATDFTERARVTGRADSPPLSSSCRPFVASSAEAVAVRPAEITSRTNEFRSDVTIEVAAATADSAAPDIWLVPMVNDGLSLPRRLPPALDDFLFCRFDSLATCHLRLGTISTPLSVPERRWKARIL